MQQLNKQYLTETLKKPYYGDRPERAIQFGEGGFLRAFFDYMLDTANEKGVFDGSVIVVKPIAYGSMENFEKQDNVYTLIERGISGDKEVSRSRVISSISRVVGAYENYDELLKCAAIPTLRFLVSNTTEAGIAYVDTDKFDDAPPSSYPAKLTRFLYERFQVFGGAADKGMILMPCELIEDNGSNLKKCVLQYADLWNLSGEFKSWLENSCKFCNTLVDKIVTGYPRGDADKLEQELGYHDALLDTTELFTFWAVEADQSVAKELPLAEAGFNVLFTDKLQYYRNRKVYILNGIHTATSLAAYLSGFDFVGDFMNDPTFYRYVDQMVNTEILPTIKPVNDEIRQFAADVLERFRNKYLNHMLLSISLNSVSKWKTRCLPTILRYMEDNKALPKNLTFSFAALIAFYLGSFKDGVYTGTRPGNDYQIKDNDDILRYFDSVGAKLRSNEISVSELVADVCAKTGYWGQNLNELKDFAPTVSRHLEKILNSSMTEAVKELVS